MSTELNQYRQFMKPAEIHKAVNSLIGIIEGIKLDLTVNSAEMDEVINWCNLQRPFQKRFPFSEILLVIDAALEDDFLSKDEIEDILWLCKSSINNTDEFNIYYDVTTSSIQQLHGIIHGIMADNTLKDLEIQALMEWLKEREFLKGTYPFDEIHALLTSTLEDGVITEDEKNLLRGFFGNFIDTRSSYNINQIELENLRNTYSITGICSVNPSINFENSVFSFTGTSTKGTRKEIAEIITNSGGIFNNGVTKKTEYLIIGGEGNPCWAFSCYGRKVEKAVELRKQGQQIIMVHEEDFWTAFANNQRDVGDIER